MYRLSRPSRLESAPAIWNSLVLPIKTAMIIIFLMLSLAVAGCGAFAQRCTEPVPVITNIDPDHAQLGVLSFVLTVKGAGFVPTSQVYWNSHRLATAYADSTQLRAVVPLEELLKAGTASIVVFTPPRSDSVEVEFAGCDSGAISNAVSFTLTP